MSGSFVSIWDGNHPVRQCIVLSSVCSGCRDRARAFAGVFMIRLNEAGLLSDPDPRWCPSLDQPSATEAALTDLTSVPSLAELHLQMLISSTDPAIRWRALCLQPRCDGGERLSHRLNHGLPLQFCPMLPWLAFRKRPSMGGLSGTTPRVSTFFMRMGGRDF